MSKYPLCLAVLLLVSLAGQPRIGAFEKDKGPARGPGHEEASTVNPGSWLVSFYGKHISAVDGDRCPSLPSCSSYSLQAIRKHGFVMGWMMTVDRLIHEGKEETRVSPVVFSRGKWLIYDPVKNNDFWWYPGERKDHE